MHLGLTTLLLALAGYAPANEARASCEVTPREDRLPEIIAAMAGQDPVWVVDGGAGRWRGAEKPIKTVWVLSRRANGALAVKGRRLDGEGKLRFRRRREGAPTEMLRVRAPAAESMRPGGAGGEIMDAYAFVSSYVFYPSPGCWELEAILGATKRRIVVWVGE